MTDIDEPAETDETAALDESTETVETAALDESTETVETAELDDSAETGDSGGTTTPAETLEREGVVLPDGGGEDEHAADAPAANEGVDVDSLSQDRVLLTLPASLRSAFKEPFGPVETDAAVVLESVAGPLIAVGDIVTYHFLQAGRPPDVAVVDEHTKRKLADDEVRETLSTPDLTVQNPPGALAEPLVAALRDAVGRDDSTTILVEGEEDLAVLPAVMVAPNGASVVYGQPDEGMVHVPVNGETKAEFRALIDRMDGDRDRFWTVVHDDA